MDIPTRFAPRILGLLTAASLLSGCGGIPPTQIAASNNGVEAASQSTGSEGTIPTPAPNSSQAQASGADESTVRFFKPGQIAIPAGLSDSDLVAAFIERTTAWIMAATSDEVYDRYMADPAGADLWREAMLAHGTYVEEMFPAATTRSLRYETEDLLKARMQSVEDTARMYFLSVPPALEQPEKYERYKQWAHLTKIVSVTKKGANREVILEYQTKSNREKTKAGFGSPDKFYPTRMDVTFDESSGSAVIEDIRWQHLKPTSIPSSR